MHYRVKGILGIIITISLILCGIKYLDRITKLKATSIRDMSYESFFDSPDEYDVIFLGTSHVMHGINSMQLWNEYGITSYNWGSPTCTLPSAYWKMINILDYATPDLIVVDCFRAVWEEKSYNEYRMHEAFDAFPLTMNKFRAIQDLMGNTDKYTISDRLEVLFPFGAYHSRWDELSELDFNNQVVDVKGCEYEIAVAEPIDISTTKEKEIIKSNMEGVNYLEKIIVECQQRNIPILLTYLPYPTSEEWKKEANMIVDIAKKYNIDYINFTDLNIIDYDSDMADANSHMNLSGQNKISRYLGQYILEKYSIDSRCNDAQISNRWNEDYDNYLMYMDDLLCAEDDILNYLMLLSCGDWDVLIDISNKDILENYKINKLLTNLSLESELLTDEVDFIYRTSDDKCILMSNFRKNGSYIHTDIGKIQYFTNEDADLYGIYLDGSEIAVDNLEYEKSIGIKVYRDEEMIDQIRFFYLMDDETGTISELKWLRYNSFEE